MCIATIAVTALNVFFDSQMSSMHPFSLVEAEIDNEYEHDDIYSEYIQSAKIQHELMTNNLRQGHQPYTMDQFVQLK